MRINWKVLLFSVLLANQAWSSKPILSITVNTTAPRTLPANVSGRASYTVTNNTSTLSSFVMQPILGITQMPFPAPACSNPIVLSQGQSCLLNLSINGSQIPHSVTAGPVICNNHPNPLACAQPSASDSLKIQSIGAVQQDNDWISVLVAEHLAPKDSSASQAYVDQVYQLAPKAEQVHIRIAGINHPKPSECAADPRLDCTLQYQPYVNVLAQLYATYSANPTFVVGFHPDASIADVGDWGCPSDDDGKCVLNESIIALNAMNKMATDNGIKNFGIYSIECPGYVIPDSTSLAVETVKACLYPAHATSGISCPSGVTLASPSVNYGDVRCSYGDSDVYGKNKLDFGYPQYYNLVQSISDAHFQLLTHPEAPYFPLDTVTTSCLDSSQSPYHVIDANLSGEPITPALIGVIPCLTPNASLPTPFPANDIFWYPSENTPDPPAAGAYLGYLMSQLPPISEAVNTNGATVYLTFSGEPQFLGGAGWTLSKIDTFHKELEKSLIQLQALGIISSIPTIKYAIWNFTQILINNR